MIKYKKMKRTFMLFAVLLSALSFLSIDAQAQYQRHKKHYHQPAATKVIVIKHDKYHHNKHYKHHGKKYYSKNTYYKKHRGTFAKQRHHKTVKVVYLTPRMMKHGRRA